MIKKVVLDKADRLYHFPFDIEDFLPKRTIAAGEKRMPIIDLAHFNWPVINYPLSNEIYSLEMAGPEDLTELKEAISSWLKSEYKIAVDPRKEIYIGQGIHRMIFDLYLAFVELGDIVLCPEPGMPFYRRMAIAVGGVPVTYPISSKSGYKPSTLTLSSSLGKSAKVLILNNPNNPFGTLLDDTDMTEIIRIASKQNAFVVNDAAYCSLARENYRPLRSFPGGSKVGLELFSFSFTFGLPYLPFGFAIGAPEVISGLRTIGKTLGAYFPKLWAKTAIEGIASYPSSELKNSLKKIDNARLAAEQFIYKIGGQAVGEKSSPFTWMKLNSRSQSSAIAASLLRRRRLLTLPGTAFGETGEGYLRLSLTASPEDYQEAIVRLSKKISIRSLSGDK